MDILSLLSLDYNTTKYLDDDYLILTLNNSDIKNINQLLNFVFISYELLISVDVNINGIAIKTNCDSLLKVLNDDHFKFKVNNLYLFKV